MLSYLCLSLGIILARLWQISNLSSLVCLLLAISIGVTLWHHKSWFISSTPTRRYAAFCLILLLAGYGYANLRINYRLNKTLTTPINHLAVSGYLNSPIQVRDSTNQADFKITSGTFSGQNITLFYPPEDILLAGHNYSLLVNLRPLTATRNLSAFDYREYLLTQDISASAFMLSNIHDNGSSFAINAQINLLRVNLINYMQTTLSRYPYSGLAIALVTGYQKLIPAEQWLVFKNSGIMHIVSISGLHITIVTSLVVFLLNLLLKFIPPLPYPKQIILAWSGITFALFYSLVAGFSIPCQRTFYLILVMGYLMTRRITIPLLNKLAITLAIVLALDPFASFSSGFWFSFLLVATIFAMSTLYQRYHSKLKFWLHLQVAVVMVSLPLTLYLFNTYPLISVITNLWAIPVIGNLLTPWLLLSSIFHCGWLLKLALWFSNYALLPVEYLAKIPPYWQVKPDLATLFIAYSGVILFLLPPLFKYKNYLAVALFISIFMVTPAPRPTYGNLQIIAFSNTKVGYALVQTKEHNLLLASSNDPQQISRQFTTTVLPYLQAQHITQLDSLMNHHSESDVAGILKDYQIKLTAVKYPEQITLNGIKIKYLEESEEYAFSLQSQSGMSYIGSGYQPFTTHEWQNIIITYPLRKLSWLYQNPSTNLLINSPLNQEKAITALLDNINLPAQNTFNLANLGSVMINSTGQASTNNPMGEN